MAVFAWLADANWGLVVTALLAILGWYKVNQLNAKRDRANRHRDIRLNYLIEAYRKIANIAGRDPIANPEEAKGLEEVLTDIQLLGNQRQMDALNAFFQQAEQHGGAPLGDVINALREELRKELGLPVVEGGLSTFRFPVKTT